MPSLGSATGTLPISLGDGEIKAALRELSEPWGRGDRIRLAIERAAKRSGLGYWRAFDIWYGKARRIESYEREQIVEALRAKRKEAARNELRELRTRLARLESLLAQTDPDFTRPHLDTTREQLRSLGGTGRTPDRAMD